LATVDLSVFSSTVDALEYDEKRKASSKIKIRTL